MQSMDRIQFLLRLCVLFVLFAAIKYFYIQHSDYNDSLKYLTGSIIIDTLFILILSPFIVVRLKTIKLPSMLVSLFYLNILLSTNFHLLVQELLKFKISYLYNFSLIVNVLSLVLLLYLCFVKTVWRNVTLTSK